MSESDRTVTQQRLFRSAPGSALTLFALIVFLIPLLNCTWDIDDPANDGCPLPAEGPETGEGQGGGLVAVFLRGDVDGSGDLDVSDSVRILNHLFLEDPANLGCADAGDVNDDGRVDVSDSIFLLLHLFGGQLTLPGPAATCGLDPTDDALGCERFDACGEPGCLSSDDIRSLVRSLLPETICVPAGLWTVGGNPFTLSVCDAASAGRCGGAAGCTVRISSVECELDSARGEATVQVEGSALGLPIVVTSAGMNQLCENDIAFSATLTVPFSLTTETDGRTELVHLGAPRRGDTAMSLNSAGGLLCDALEAFEAHFFGAILRQVEDGARSRLLSLGTELLGRELCLE